MTDVRDDAFDRALAVAARSWVDASLPADVFEAPSPSATRTWRSTSAPFAVAIVVVVLAVGLAVGAPLALRPGEVAGFRTGDAIADDLRSAGYTCQPGAAASSGAPRMEALVCTATRGPLMAAVVVSEDAGGRVGEIHVKSDIVGAPTARAERDRADLLLAAVGLPFDDPSTATEARVWLSAALSLEPGRRAATTIDGTPLAVERRLGGGYQIVLGDLHPGPTAEPSR